ncbi:MAG: cytosol aminopeptidase, leucyl aminopeptidase [Parcubacteria group bacterium GW2011_GWC1_38_6]|nr:MAG: cytosol aminopeptidase, leucyl aminopeptidase [Parcubacteria group bacterium GW2011_GWC1_38_6]
MQINCVSTKDIKAEGLFFGFFKEDKIEKDGLFMDLPSDIKKLILQFSKDEFKKEEGEIKSLWLSSKNPSKVVLFGLGDKAKWNERKIHLIPRLFIQYAKNNKIESFTTCLDKDFGSSTKEAAKNFTINTLLADFEFNKYKEEPKGGWSKIKNVNLVSKQSISEIQAGIKEGIIIGEETNLCRNLSNTPGGDMTPARLAEAAAKAAKTNGFHIKTLRQKEISVF